MDTDGNSMSGCGGKVKVSTAGVEGTVGNAKITPKSYIAIV